MGKTLRILIGCEMSGIVRDAFTKQGFDAWSCDVKETLSPGQHIQGDVLEVIGDDWDAAIFHPPCTYLANSSSSWLYKDGKKVNGLDPERWMNMLEGAVFFKKLLNADIPHIAVENPVIHGHAKKIIGVQQTQTIQPYEHGHKESKRTCLWLKNLPKLTPTDIVEPEWVKDKNGEVYRDSGGYRYSQSAYSPIWNNQTPSGQNKLDKTPDRAMLRSLTYTGIAKGMALQWGKHIKSQYYANTKN